jgi:hypothetical protein
MGEQVANNREPQMLIYLSETDGKWSIITEAKGTGLIRGEYTPIGSRLIYPRKWGRKKGAEVLLQHLINDNEEICRKANDRLKYLYMLKDEINKWTN